MLRSSLFAALIMGGSSTLAAAVDTNPDSVDLSSVILDTDADHGHVQAVQGFERCKESIDKDVITNRCEEDRHRIHTDARLMQLVAVR